MNNLRVRACMAIGIASTAEPANAILPVVRVLVGEIVTVDAGFPARVISGQTHASKYVDLPSRRLEMLRPYTHTHSAKMVQIKTNWDLADEQLVGESVGAI